MNEETILNVNAKEQVQNIPDTAKKQKKKGNSWANVSLCGISGILLGAGSAISAQSFLNREKGGDEGGNEGEQTVTPTDVQLSTNVNDNQSFADAFAAARAEVGPGGVFTWHGGVYSTYTAEEWAAKTPEEQTNFSSSVHVSKHIDEIQTLPNDDNPTIVYVENLHVHTDGNETEPMNVNEPIEDVHVVGFSDYDGHLAAHVDFDGDGEDDITVVDIDDNHEISDPDIVIDNYGNSATIAQLNEEDGDTPDGDTYYVSNPEEDSYYSGEEEALEDSNDESEDFADLENPDVAEDMPDYMDDVII